MTPQTLLQHADEATLWPAAQRAPAGQGGDSLADAYQSALAVRALRIARGEQPSGFKVGFTNRAIWPRYNVFAPIWGTIWRKTLQFCEQEGAIDLAGTCQPRIEPECVFGIAKAPGQGVGFDELFDCLDWVAPGFEVVQSHCADWKFAAEESVADSGLHAHLLVGVRKSVRRIAHSAEALEAVLARTPVSLYRDDELVDGGIGANVLDGPLHALHYFLMELQRCPGAPSLQRGDIVTTGTWTDPWPVVAGQTWRAEFEAPLVPLSVSLS